MMFDGACSSCGRRDCKRYGDRQCQEARKLMFDEFQKRIEYFEKQIRDRRNAAQSDEAKEKP